MKESVNGEETWYRISTLVPRSFPFSSKHAVVLSQWHERVKLGHPGYRPPLSHRLIDGEFFVFLWNMEIQTKKNGEGQGKILYRETKFEPGLFHEFVYRVVWLPNAKGIVRGWRRLCGILDCKSGKWRRFIDYKGPVGYPDAMGYYFKAGLYTVYPFEKSLVAYLALYCAGATAASVGAIAPIFEK